MPNIADPLVQIVLLLGIICAMTTFFYPKIGLMIMLVGMLLGSDLPVRGGDQMSAGRGASVRIEDVLLILISGGWLLHRAKTRMLSVIKSVPVNKGVIVMTGIILIASTFGFINHTNPLGRGLLFTMKRLEYFWIFFMTLHVIDRAKDAKLCIHILLGASAVVAVYGLYQYWTLPDDHRLVSGGITTTAGYGRANILGSFLLIVIGMTLGLYIHEGGKTHLLYIALCMALLGILILTKSRGAYISLPPMLAFVLVLTRSRRLLMLLVYGAGIVSFLTIGSLLLPGPARLAVSMQTSQIAEQFESIVQVAQHGVSADSSLEARVMSWKYSINWIKKFPLLGQGVGSISLGWTDNQYVRETLETGIIGLLCFLFMNAVVFGSTYHLYKYTDDSFVRGLTCGFMTGHVGLMVHGITVSNFYTILPMETFWFVTAIIMVYYNRFELALLNHEQQSEPETPTSINQTTPLPST